ncbi:TlpA disulfide reductase family protein [Bacteroides sp. 224]|uniref:TlpA family protein disulfide reductase n=1 Tax=Bacteroides sp. 224 TaxID=2302936 RepID=UPI0013D2F47F|nr:TlpA disulfide reductase family protein [Bacteroides sp. 224]NDV65413.1 TlpA family protein disulfide reductase [Bacteroides sp. 224]
MKQILLALAALIIISCGKAEESKTVKISGSFKNIKSSSLKLSYAGSLAFLSEEGSYELAEDSDKNFDLTIEIDKPTYFSIYRNQLYLTPGDSIHIIVEEDPAQSSITGSKGVDANTYLKKRIFPKGGSYLDAGKNLKLDMKEMLNTLDSFVTVRKEELAAVTNVSQEFKELESKRIIADYVNSFLYYPSYKLYKLQEFTLSSEEYKAQTDEYFENIKQYVQPILEDIASDDRYLEVEVVRLVLYRASKMDVFTVNQSDRFKKLIEVSNQMDRMKKELTPEIVSELQAYGDNITYDDFKTRYLNRLNSVTRLMEGQPAPDIKLTDIDGNEKMLSDFKGKTIYVDLWATWCGPCRMQTPHYKKLSEEYKNIQFIAISIDEDKKAWEGYVKNEDHANVIELLSTDPDLRNNWNVPGIPKFLLIDEDFKIISSSAPRPSEIEKITAILEKYNKE